MGLLIAGLGGLLRLSRLETLSLWLDEGTRIVVARLPWTTILGFGGWYDAHPPLYYALTKAATLVAPEVVAGRLVSAVAGTATIVVLYALGRQLLDPVTALIASLVLSVCPLHVWYSQEVAPYAVTGLLVGLAYLGLVAWLRRPRPILAMLYGLAVCGAMYSSTSAFFALAGQVPLLAIGARAHRRRALPLFGALVAAVLAFLPWLLTLGIARAAEIMTQAQYAVSLRKVGTSILSLAGLGGRGTYFWSDSLPAWDALPGLQPWLLLSVGVVVTLGCLALWRQSAVAAAVGLGLLAGPIVVGAVVSVAVPSYVERALLSGTLGWALVVGAAATSLRLPVFMTCVARGSTGVVVTGSLVTLSVFLTTAVKEDWRALARATTEATRSVGLPILTDYPGTATLIELYAPRLPGRVYVAAGGGSTAGDVESATADSPGVWYAHRPDPASPGERQLAGLGFEPVLSNVEAGGVQLDLYVRAEAAAGHEIAVNGRFEGDPASARGWELSPGGVQFGDAGASGRSLVLVGLAETAATARPRAVMRTPADRGLYTLEFWGKNDSSPDSLRAYLVCAAASGAPALVAPSGRGASVPADAQWHRVRVAALCPEVRWVQIDLRNEGGGAVSFRDVRLFEELARDHYSGALSHGTSETPAS